MRSSRFGYKESSIGQQGFGLVGVLLIIVVLALAGSAGVYAYHRDHKSTVKQLSSSNNKSTHTSKSPSNSATNMAAPITNPVLGATWKTGLMGFGTTKPTEISLDGDPTSIATNITWQSWGDSKAVGTGTSTYVAPGQTTSEGSGEQATIVAFNLGTCNGVSAYTAIEWYFPQHGQTFNTNPGYYWNACTGKS